jgi:putative transposase
MGRYIDKSHNVSVLLCHLVFPAKYRRAVFDAAVDQALREVCLEIEARYQVTFLEIGTDKDRVHFLVQSVPTYSGSTAGTCGSALACPTVLAGARFGQGLTSW